MTPALAFGAYFAFVAAVTVAAVAIIRREAKRAHRPDPASLTVQAARVVTGPPRIGGIAIVEDPRVPIGEVRLVDASGRAVARIVDVGIGVAVHQVDAS